LELLDDHTLLIHAVWVSEEDIDLCCEYTQPVEYTKGFIFSPGKLYFL